MGVLQSENFETNSLLSQESSRSPTIILALSFSVIIRVKHKYRLSRLMRGSSHHHVILLGSLPEDS